MIIHSCCSFKTNSLLRFSISWEYLKVKNYENFLKGTENLVSLINTAMYFYSIVLHSFIVLNIGTAKEPYGPETCQNSKNLTTSAIKIQETTKVPARGFFFPCSNFEIEKTTKISVIVLLFTQHTLPEEVANCRRTASASGSRTDF